MGVSAGGASRDKRREGNVKVKVESTNVERKTRVRELSRRPPKWKRQRKKEEKSPQKEQHMQEKGRRGAGPGDGKRKGDRGGEQGNMGEEEKRSPAHYHGKIKETKGK